MLGGGTTLADAWVRLRADGSALGPEVRATTIKEAGDVGTVAGRTFGDRMRTAVKAGAIAGGALLGAALATGVRDSIAASRDLAETQSKVRVLFGQSAAAVEAFAATASRQLGQSRQTALDGAAAFAIYGRAAGKSGADLVSFSTKLTSLASDVASFSNADPAAVIADFGSAMRGEFDPIEKYGVLLNESNVKHRALAMGIIKTTKDALTPQQRVLAVQAEIYAQTGAAQGDFARTSAGLANQQRILAAQTDNLKVTVGNALLPVMTRLVTFLNDRAVPAFQRFTTDHGPAMAAIMGRIGAVIRDLVDQARGVDWARLFERGTEAVERLGPALRDTAKETPSLRDTMRVTGVVMGFLADHSDELAAALPYLAAGLVLVKVATIAANVANAISPALMIAQVLASRRLAASNLELAAATTAATTATRAQAVSTGAATVAENAGVLARGRAIVAAAAHRVAMLASSAATGIATGAQWLLNAALTANPIGIVIVAIGALVAALVYAYRNSETFRNIVNRVWSDIRTTIMSVVNWFTGTAWPALRGAYDAITAATNRAHVAVAGAWTRIQDAIGSVWRWLNAVVFDPWRRLFTQTIPQAVADSVAFVADRWNRLRDVAKAPVRFLIETVVNDGLIGTFNRVAGFLGIGKRIERVGLPGGFAAGGYFSGMLPGPPSDVDNMVATGPRGQGIGLAGGEFVVNARKTARWRPVLEYINGYADGGLVDFFTNPAGFVRDAAGAGLASMRSRFSEGVGPLAAGVGSTLLDGMVDRVRALVTETGPSGTIGVGRAIGGIGAQAMMAMLRTVFPDLGLISGFRPGSRTLSGGLSYHAMNRAVDVAPIRAVATWIRAARGGATRELITPWAELNLLNGRPHAYSAAVMNQHNFAGGNAHIHWALARGGIVPRVFDRGGPWQSGTVGVNTSGRTEHVASGATMDQLVALMMELLDATREAPDRLAGALSGGLFMARQLGRAR